MGSTFFDVLINFARQVSTNFASKVKAQPEDQLKRPVQDLIEQCGVFQKQDILSKTEAQVEALGGRPDLAVAVKSLLTGYIELKAPEVSIDPKKFDKRNKEQFEKFKSLPNLIYTNGHEWALYRSGERIKQVKFSENTAMKGEQAFTSSQADALEDLFRDFLFWKPITPTSPKALAKFLAPLCRLVREDVNGALKVEDSPISAVYKDWKKTLFPDADEAKFADAYAQTLTYALLLAKISGFDVSRPEIAAKELDKKHGLLGSALQLLGDSEVRENVGLSLEVLIRCINALDIEKLQNRFKHQWAYSHDPNHAVDANAFQKKEDPWLYFYEDFLAEYDPKLRANYGVYYTPTPVILAQIRLTDRLLKDKFKKDMGFASKDVVVLDPAAGTGAFPLAIMQHALAQIEDEYGKGERATYASQLANNIHGFEYLVGPYAVGHLRLTQKILEEEGKLPKDGLHFYLADTLENPNSLPLENVGFMYRKLTEEHRRVNKIKKDTRVLVCVGNPPYDRQERSEDDIAKGTDLHGGWVRFGEQRNKNNDTEGILKDFVELAKASKKGKHVRNLYNDYVYFWRWALWKVFEQTQEQGIVSFITAASYMRGPGFSGMREHMRRTLDELWIIDLEGDGIGARKTENVFAIRTPVAIAIGVRYGKPNPNEPALVRYTRLTGTREEKLTRLAGIYTFEDLDWKSCFTDWQAPFVPEGEGDYFSYPELTSIFPWQHAGIKLHRTFPIAPDPQTLQLRLQSFIASPEKSKIFKETRDRKVALKYPDFKGKKQKPLQDLKDLTEVPIVRYGYRTFDRLWIMADTRFGDLFRAALWNTQSQQQVFLTSSLSEILGTGPAASVTALAPDIHHFSGRGAKDIVPLWRNTAATEPNITQGVLKTLEEEFKHPVTPEDLFAYVYGILATPEYVEQFSEELTIPGPRIPITKDFELFRKVVSIGRTLIGWHTYGERFGGTKAKGKARVQKAISSEPDGYPEKFSYDASTQTLTVGEGEIHPVSSEIFNFSVSGLEVVKSWLSYRMKERSGKKSSPLDEITSEVWTQEMTLELLELLWLLEKTIEQYPNMNQLLKQIIATDNFDATEFPEPTDAEKAPPSEDRDSNTPLF
ncbi:type ISP restriction/modification enzyme [Deinococcus cellulosilyticus]|uniref:site-specific DNA-methyltransferase (adenine-specific) n=1 Tax=Deinococcus cellulosilyticus (strain DSM 18568 / NBRC 106333 / KACC 11606 / 5516J-15) TaxID=1223518 RepID=A0A511NB96_DEIC1|nr:type ISP restriction/modification enzyme [Deinococcus cellulosilyticus]GEM49661.1 DNA methyltransferase [Deinococcus cellulosilyticus NBRC 106333 = KACC 11606]